MKHVGVCRARKHFSGLVNRVHYRGDRIVLVRHGREMAAVVPIRDLDRLVDLETEELLRIPVSGEPARATGVPAAAAPTAAADPAPSPDTP